MSRYAKKKKNGIPDRWLDYSAVGRRLGGTRFVAFKVPLKQSLNRWLSGSDVFGPWELLDAVKRDGHELGLIIDLTFTTRYYSLQDVPESLLVVKIFTAGHEVPSDDTILSFKRVVRRFLRDNADNDKLIGVHCTHGLNRTGYLICRYLIDVDGMDPVAAVQLFNSARGHDMERHNYLQDLQQGPSRSNEGMDESEQEPMRGRAASRLSDSDIRDERRPHHGDLRPHHGDLRPHHGDLRPHHGDLRPHHGDLRPHRSFPPRGSHRSHPPPPSGGPWPGPPLPGPYHWAPPRPEEPWRRPPRSERSWPAEEDWRPPPHRQEDWRPPPHRQEDWRPPPHRQEDWRPPPHRQEDWRLPPHQQEDWRRGPPPSLPPYTPRWTSESSTRQDRPEGGWGGNTYHHY